MKNKMNVDIKCKIKRLWHKETYAVMGYIVDRHGKKTESGIVRNNDSEALLDAERMKEELVHGIR